MKFSIITVVYNCVTCIEHCIRSVTSQSYPGIEYIIIDGKSTDGTLEIIGRHMDRITKVVSEKDQGYVYAMNKGLEMATGDVIGFLHADDFYAHNAVIERVADTFKAKSPDSLYGDLVYVKKDNPDKITRYWESGEYKAEKLMQGWMPPHPTFFVKSEIYEKYGYFNTDFKIAADYEIVLRFLRRDKISTYYLPEVLVKMRAGGVSNRSLSEMARKSFEDYKACKIYGIERSFSAIISKNLAKIPQFFAKKRKIA